MLSRNAISIDVVRSVKKQMLSDLITTLDPQVYLESLGFTAFPWQVFVLDAIKKGYRWIHITGARQSGKTFITAGMPVQTSKNEKALSLIYAPSDEQAGLSIEYAKEYIARDETYPELKLNSVEHIKLPNGSYIKANTSNAKTKRGRSKPRLIIFDEAALIEDELYGTITPMLTDNPNCVVIALSTPYGKSGWFYEARKKDKWLKVEVRAPWDIVENRYIVPAEPEEQYRKRMLKQGIHAFYSPRHYDKQLIQDALDDHGALWVKQEYFCEFVEPEDMAFTYADIDKAFSHEGVKPLPMEIPEVESGIKIF